MKKLLLGLLAGLAILLVVSIIALGVWPVPADVPQVGAGGPAGDPTPPTTPDRRGTGQVIEVQSGDSIQAAIDQAQPGDTIRVQPGLYQEALLVQTESLTLEGVVQGEQRAVIDGRGQDANGILGVADYFTVTGFKTVNHTSNGVTTQGLTGSVFRDLITENPGDYGLFPVLSTDVLIENVVTSGAVDTGIYVGQSTQIIVRDSEAFGNVSGIEIENSTDALVENNYVHDNAGGILVFVLPGKKATEGARNRIVDNRIENNNGPNFARPEMSVSLVPSGTGMLILASDTTEVTGNLFKGNKSTAIGIIALTDLGENAFFGPDTEKRGWDVPVRPDGNWIHGNTYENNAYDPDQAVLDFGFQGADLLWSTTGADNRWDEPGATAFPSPLPSSAWPGFLRTAYQRVLNFLVNNVL